MIAGAGRLRHINRSELDPKETLCDQRIVISGIDMRYFFSKPAHIESVGKSSAQSLALDDNRRALLLLGVPRARAALHIADGTACGAWVHLCLRRQTQGSCACCYRPRFAFGHRQ